MRFSVLGFRSDLRIELQAPVDKLKNYCMKINYPQHIVDHAFQKARSLSRDVALKESAKSDATIIPYVITCNPSLPRIGIIIKKYWGLLALSKKI